MKATMTIRKLNEHKFASRWRAFGLERCVECGELEVANSYFFPDCFEKKKLVTKPICRYCKGTKAPAPRSPWEIGYE